jgi:hypothetical protein
MRFLKNLIFILLAVISIGLILATVKGLPGVNGKLLRFQSPDDYDTYPTSPFEVINSNSRFTLIESIVERGNFFFNDDQAKFSAPDIVYYRGKYFSIFTPGISFLALPFYLVGRALGLTQIITFSFNIIALFINIYLIICLARKFGASSTAGFLGALIYVFGTNSLAYTLSLSQHQFSTTLVLLALLIASSKTSVLNNLFMGLVFSVGVIVDIPNLFALFPMFVYVMFKHFSLEDSRLKINLKIVSLFISLLPFIGLFAWYNYSLTGSFTKLGQVLGRSDFPHKEAQSKNLKPDNPFGYQRKSLPLGSRLQLNGFYQLLVSPERGWIYYSPVVLIGLIGLGIGLKNPNTKVLSILSISSIIVTLVVYSMHGDPWGGWAFGSRYMIPSSAIAMAAFALTFSRFKKRLLYFLFTVSLVIYSVIVSISGALTTTLIPPKVEAIHFENPVPYTYQLNFDYIFKNNSTGSLVYHLVFQNMLSVKVFYFGYVALALLVIITTYFLATPKYEKHQ